MKVYLYTDICFEVSYTIYTIVFIGQIGGNCVFNGKKDGIYVCPNSVESCTMNCDDCASVTLYSGSSNTIVNCLTKDSCPFGNIYVGKLDTNECNKFTNSDVTGTKTSAIINCGSKLDTNDDSACKNMNIHTTGVFTDNITINIDSKYGMANGHISCDITNSNCDIFCNNKDSCKDLIYECSSKSNKCSCNGNYCPRKYSRTISTNTDNTDKNHSFVDKANLSESRIIYIIIGIPILLLFIITIILYCKHTSNDPLLKYLKNDYNK